MKTTLKSKQRRRIIILCCLFYVIASPITSSQIESRPEGSILRERQLPEIHLKRKDFDALLTDLSLDYNIPIGLELANESKVSEMYQLDFLGGSVEKLMDEIIEMTPSYRWTMVEDVIYVYPLASDQNSFLKMFLSAKAEPLTIENDTTCWAFVRNLVESPEIKQLMLVNGMSLKDINFSGTYFPHFGKNFEMVVDADTVLSVLNRVVLSSPTAKIWVLRISPDSSKFSLIINSVNDENINPGIVNFSRITM